MEESRETSPIFSDDRIHDDDQNTTDEIGAGDDLIKPVEIKPVHIGDQKLRSKLKFEVVPAKVVEENGKKHVTYTVMMKRAGGEVHPAVISRRYNDFCYLYERILCTFHPSIL